MKTINTSNINEARKQIEKARKENTSEKIALLSQDDEFNRKALEIKGLNILIINEDINIKDYSKQRNSSLNEVLCDLAKKNNIKIAIDIEKISKKPYVEKAKSLSRLKQNIMLCKKSGTELIFLDNKQKKELQSLFITLGASTKQAEEAVKNH